MAKQKKLPEAAPITRKFDYRPAQPTEFTGVTYTVEKAPKGGGPLNKFYLMELHIQNGVLVEKRIHKHAMIQEELFMRLDSLNREMFIQAAKIRRNKREVA